MATNEELELAGITGKQFLEELFEYEYCTECGLDADAHTAIPLGLGDYGTNWFARCDHLVECAYCDEEFTTEPVRDPEEVAWRGEQARTYCSEECSVKHAEQITSNGPLGRSDPR